MKNLLVMGAGGHGKVVADTARESGIWDNIAFLDDLYPATEKVLSWPIIGRLEQASALLEEYHDAAVAIGDNVRRVELLKRFSAIGFNLPAIIHPTAFVSRDARIGEASVVFAQSAINAGVEIGFGCIINTGVIVDHECVLGEGVHLSPGVRLGGRVNIGSRSWLGVGAMVINDISIGESVTIGAGSVVIGNVPDNVTVVGVPGRVIKHATGK